MADFRNRYDAWLVRWNAEATQKKQNFDRTLLLQERETIVANAQQALHSSLSTDGLIRFSSGVQQAKLRVQIITGGNQ